MTMMGRATPTKVSGADGPPGASLQVTVAGDEVRLRLGGTSRVFANEGVGAAFTEGRDLVLLAHDTTELARERYEQTPAVLGAAFRDHGYPWYDGDPHATGS